MIKTFTLVRMNAGWSREDFFKRWCEHTRDWDLRDHPEISLNRLMLIEGDSEFVGMAENHWPDEESLAAAANWYRSDAGRAHWDDLASFMDIENSPTVTVSAEAHIDSDRGIRLIQQAAATTSNVQ